jgi:putative DNA methylase
VEIPVHKGPVEACIESNKDRTDAVASYGKPDWKPEVEFFQQALGFRVGNYGMTKWGDLFTDRQLVALTTFSDLVQVAQEQVRREAIAAGWSEENLGIDAGGAGATAYAEAVSTYAAFAVDKGANYWSSLCSWHSGRDTITSTFSRQVVPIVWDFAEAHPFSASSGSWMLGIEQASRMLLGLGIGPAGIATQSDAQTQNIAGLKVISTDPPYYDNIGYADLSDFFYVWMRRSQMATFPKLFATVAVPKVEELVATPARHGGRENAETFFLEGMTQAMHRLAEQSHPAYPVTIYYAFKQSEMDKNGIASTGWETFLDAVIRAGFAITGTWPVRTEYTSNLKTTRSALASSIVLVCRPRESNAPTATLREFLAALTSELPIAVKHLQRGNIAPVDLAQAAIGPGMAVYTFLKRIQVKKGENDLFQFFPVNIHVAPQSSQSQCILGGDTLRSYSHAATLSRDCA